MKLGHNARSGVVLGRLLEKQEAEYGNGGDQSENHQAILVGGNLAKLGIRHLNRFTVQNERKLGRKIGTNKA
jgi:hypothetical protein